MSRRALFRGCCLSMLLSLASTPAALGGADVIVGDLYDPQSYGAAGGIDAYAIGTISCNIGDVDLLWIPNTNQHPVIGQNLFRLRNGRFEQIGQAWLKHGFAALTQNLCATCQDPGTSTLLGVGCSDPYSGGLNGSQGGLGPKSEVNAFTGAFAYPYGMSPTGNNTIRGRLQALTADVDPAQNSGALYYVEGHYVTPDDAAAGNLMNNASWRRVTFNASRQMALSGSTVRQQPAILAWQQADAGVSISQIDVPGDGRLYVGLKTTNLGGGNFQYEIAVYNMNSHRSVQSVTVPLPGGGTVVSNLGFHDVPYHSGEPYDGTDWPGSSSSTQVSWATTPFGTNQNANAIRWGTLYNFRFQANVDPSLITQLTLGLFRPGTPSSVTVNLTGPQPPANDACANAAAVSTGTTPFSTLNATLDGPAEPGLCNFNAYTQIDKDVWYRWTASCTGTATVGVCDADYDTKLAVYGSACPSSASALACNDDACGTGGTRSQLTFACTSGVQYLIRVGGVAGASGSGNLTISCAGAGLPNDNCVNATPIGNGTFNFDTTGAGTDGPDEPGACNFFSYTNVGSDIWYRYTASCTGTVTVDLCGSSYDCKVAVYGSTCPSVASAIACNDDACGAGGTRSSLTFSATAGQQYLIRVGGYNAETGVGVMVVSCAATGPSGEDCISCIPISNGTFNGSTAGSTGTDVSSCTTGDTIDEWYCYTATCTGTVTASLCGSAFDTSISVFSGCVSGQLACNDDSATCGTNSVQSRTTFAATAGVTYYVRVSGWQGQTGAYTLTMSCSGVTPPANNNCASATPVTEGSYAFSNANATTDGPDEPTACAFFGYTQVGSDIWYRYTASCTGDATVDLCTATFDTKVAVYTGICPSTAAAIVCNDDACGTQGLRSSLSFQVVGGQEYLIRVGGYNGATGSGTMVISCVGTIPPGDALRGGKLYDRWWVITNDPEPTGDHPLYPGAGQQAGSDTFRCKECHGWDYLGNLGEYATGVHATGIRGVYGTTLTDQQIFDLLKFNTPPNGHNYAAYGLSDQDLADLIAFMRQEDLNVRNYITAGGAYIGSVPQGQVYYETGNTVECSACHGIDGTAINFGTPQDPVWLGTLADTEPGRVFHKTRYGNAGGPMPQWRACCSDQGAADIGAYLQQGNIPSDCATDGPPTITQSPVSQTICPGGPVTFTVTATGVGEFFYQWRRNGGDLFGETGTSLTIAAVSAGDAGSYDVVVTNVCGDAFSSAATLTIGAAPSISGQPASQTACSGGSATFSVVAGGVPSPSYQWRKGGVPIGGATGSSYTINPVSGGDAGSYDVVVTNSCGTATSSPATLTVNTGPQITADPASVNACPGEPAAFSVSATGTAPLAYQWRRNTIDIGGATAATYSIPAVTPADAGSYDVVVSNACGSVTSAAAALTVPTCAGPGDMNCDGMVDFFDIDPFLLALFDPAAYVVAYPACDPLNGDLNNDGGVDFFDIDPFLNCLFNGVCN